MITKKQLQREILDLRDYVDNVRDEGKKKIASLEDTMNVQYLELKHYITVIPAKQRVLVSSDYFNFREDVIDLLKVYYPAAIINLRKYGYNPWGVDELGDDMDLKWTLFVDGSIWEKKESKE